MSMNIKPENRRLLEALEYIDDKIISDVLAEVKVPAAVSPERDKKATRRSIKYVLALAACMLLLGAVIPVVTHLIDSFSAGHGEHNDPYSLSQAELDAINEAWSGGVFAKSPEDVGYLKGSKFIYGKYDGAIVLGWKSITAEYSEESVAGCIFKHRRGGGIVVYCDGEIYSLSQVYDNGILTAGQIKDIWRKHQINILGEDENFEDEYIYGDYLNPIKDLEPLTKSQIAEINAEWAALYPEYVGDVIDIDKLNRGLNYRYLGTIGGKTIIWIAGSGDAETKTVHECEFSYSSSFDIIVFYSSSAEFIEQAAERWTIRSDQTALIHERNKEYEEYFANRAKNEAEPVDIPKPVYLNFTPDLEHLTLKQMYEIREAYAHYCWLQVKDTKSSEEAEAIYHAAWDDLFSTDFDNSRYYGIIDDQAVFVVVDGIRIVIGDHVTFLPADNIYVYSFDKKEIRQVELGDFSEKGETKYVQRHNQYVTYWGRQQTNSDAETDAEFYPGEIIPAYVEKYGKDEYSKDLSSYSMKIYGIFDDVCAVYINNCLVEYPELITTEVVNGFEFIYSTTNKMKIYHKGEFYSIEEAYANSILDDKSLEEIYNNYKVTHQSFYDD